MSPASPTPSPGRSTGTTWPSRPGRRRSRPTRGSRAPGTCVAGCSRSPTAARWMSTAGGRDAPFPTRTPPSLAEAPALPPPEPGDDGLWARVRVPAGATARGRRPPLRRRPRPPPHRRGPRHHPDDEPPARQRRPRRLAPRTWRMRHDQPPQRSLHPRRPPAHAADDRRLLRPRGHRRRPDAPRRHGRGGPRRQRVCPRHHRRGRRRSSGSPTGSARGSCVTRGRWTGRGASSRHTWLAGRGPSTTAPTSPSPARSSARCSRRSRRPSASASARRTARWPPRPSIPARRGRSAPRSATTRCASSSRATGCSRPAPGEGGDVGGYAGGPAAKAYLLALEQRR